MVDNPLAPLLDELVELRALEDRIARLERRFERLERRLESDERPGHDVCVDPDLQKAGKPNDR